MVSVLGVEIRRLFGAHTARDDPGRGEGGRHGILCFRWASRLLTSRLLVRRALARNARSSGGRWVHLPKK